MPRISRAALAGGLALPGEAHGVRPFLRLHVAAPDIEEREEVGPLVVVERADHVAQFLLGGVVGAGHQHVRGPVIDGVRAGIGVGRPFLHIDGAHAQDDLGDLVDGDVHERIPMCPGARCGALEQRQRARPDPVLAPVPTGSPVTRWVGGLDGCRGAWAGVLLDLDDPARFRAARFARVADLLDAPEAPLRVGIDIPIGLDTHVTAGGRVADRAARAMLGSGRSSVFPVPARVAVYAESYDAAKVLARENSTPPSRPRSSVGTSSPISARWTCCCAHGRTWGAPARGASRDRLPPPQRRCAPRGGQEGSGARGGLAERRALLAAAGLPEALIAARSAGIGADDHLDALAGLVVARDLLAGRARPLPDPPGRDAHGLPIVIWMPAGPPVA